MPRKMNHPLCYVCDKRPVRKIKGRDVEEFFCSLKCAEAQLGALMSAAELPWWDPTRRTWVGGAGDWAGELPDDAEYTYVAAR